MPELWQLYDGDKNPTGKTMLRGEPVPPGFWHIVVSIWTLTADGRLLLTRRHPDKPFGLLWEGTAGSVLAGESSREGALRELREETGLRAEPERFRLLSSEKTERFFLDDYLYLCPLQEPVLALQPEEVAEACLIDPKELPAWRERFSPPAWARLEHDRELLTASAEACAEAWRKMT